MDAEHVLAGAQRAAAQDAQPSPGEAPRHELVSISDQRCRMRARKEGCVGAHRRRNGRRVVVRPIDRARRIAGGYLSHGCSKFACNLSS